MNALVTGGAGFIGSNLSKLLVSEGHDVIVLDNLLSGYRCNIDAMSEVRFIEGDIRDEDLVNAAMKGIDVVFHLAASVGNKRSIDYPVEDAEINVIGTLRVLEAARQQGVRKIVASSSAGIFGELKKLPIAEDHQVAPDSPYSSTKLCMEKECLVYGKMYDIEAVCMRYFNVYGPNQRFDAYGNVIPIFAFRLLRDETLTIYGDGEQTRDFINVGDVARANYQAATAAGASGAFNIASGTRITINELAASMAATCGRELKVEYASERNFDVRHSLADISAATAAFGFHPQIGLENGLIEYFEWVNMEIEREHAGSDTGR